MNDAATPVRPRNPRAEPPPLPGVGRRLLAARVRDALLRLPRPLQPPRLRARQEWSIGVYRGDDVTGLGAAPDVANPVLTREDITDVPADIVADPFIVETSGTFHMFFEVLNRRSGRGEIGLAASVDGRAWSYLGRVLAEPFHLSYPHVLHWDGAQYMLPEASATGEVRLYRARSYPTGWEHVATLLSGGLFHDATPFHHDGRWWLYVETDPARRSRTLRLYQAPALLGPWEEHPASPLVADDPSTARPGGRVLFVDGTPVRLAQDCRGDYGTRVRAFAVTTLTQDAYAEEPLGTVLEPRGEGWNAGGMHHLDAMRRADGTWLAVVDGRTPGRPRRGRPTSGGA